MPVHLTVGSVVGALVAGAKVRRASTSQGRRQIEDENEERRHYLDKARSPERRRAAHFCAVGQARLAQLGWVTVSTSMGTI